MKRWQETKRNKWSSGKDNIYCKTYNIVIAYIMMSVAYSEPYERSRMECFAKIIISKKQLTIFAKRPILDVLQGSEYASGCLNLFFHLFLIFQNHIPRYKRMCAVTTHQAVSSSSGLIYLLKRFLKCISFWYSY